MLLKAIHTVVGDETYKPGDIFLIDDFAQAARLIETGAAVPVRKKITLNFSPKSNSDGIAKNLMDEKRQSDSDKPVIKIGCDAASSEGEVSVSEDGKQNNIGGRVYTSIDTRVRAESDHAYTHEDHTIQPKARSSVSANDVKQFVKKRANKESGLAPGLQDQVNN